MLIKHFHLLLFSSLLLLLLLLFFRTFFGTFQLLPSLSDFNRSNFILFLSPRRSALVFLTFLPFILFDIFHFLCKSFSMISQWGDLQILPFSPSDSQSHNFSILSPTDLIFALKCSQSPHLNMLYSPFCDIFYSFSTIQPWAPWSFQQISGFIMGVYCVS